MKILKELKEVKRVFIPPKKKYYFGKLTHGTPYFYPMRFNSTIVSFRKLQLKSKEEVEKYEKDYPHLIKHNKNYRFKNLPMVRRSKDWIFRLFGNSYWLQIGWPIMIHTNDLGWKDKFDSPRFEWSPAFYIFFFKWQFCMWWGIPDGNTDRYYEQILWYLYYANKDIEKAEKTWPWQDFKTKKSTWDKTYIL